MGYDIGPIPLRDPLLGSDASSRAPLVAGPSCFSETSIKKSSTLRPSCSARAPRDAGRSPVLVPAEPASSLVSEMAGEAMESMSSSARLKNGCRRAFWAVMRFAGSYSSIWRMRSRSVGSETMSLRRRIDATIWKPSMRQGAMRTAPRASRCSSAVLYWFRFAYPLRRRSAGMGPRQRSIMCRCTSSCASSKRCEPVTSSTIRHAIAHTSSGNDHPAWRTASGAR
mmetsp:Transcript_46435/g.110627  ORF Transcript_46435/g.110627 Transcript_46435/m.110627 type:complete len:225 (+) Transcript_46435:430-1104(+)